MSAAEVDALPLSDFYSYIAGLEQMIEENQRQIARMESQRNRR